MIVGRSTAVAQITGKICREQKTGNTVRCLRPDQAAS
jgi:hypothetical protein